jgi:hypothetical protein
MAEKTVDNELYDNHGEIELAGSANAYTATTARAVTGYYKGLRFSAKANHTNTGATTLALNGMSAVAIRKHGTAALVGGEIVSGQYYDFEYDAANGNLQILNPSIGDGSVTNAQLASMAQSTIKGRAEGAGTGAPQDLTAEQARDVLGLDTDDSPTFNGLTVDGAGPSDPVLTVSGTTGNPKIELGRVDGSASLPHIDFHSGATAADYDVRMLASGGSGSDGGGTLNITSAALQWNSANLLPTLATEQATTSGTAFDFSISSSATLIHIIFNEVSLSGTDNILVQLGDAGGIETTGYVSTGAQGTATVSSTSGFIIRGADAGRIFSGIMTLVRVNALTWICSQTGKSATTLIAYGGGSKSLSASITQLRITRDGTNTFDAGSVNVLQ